MKHKKAIVIVIFSGLVKAISTAGKGVAINSTACYQCHKSLIANNFVKEETTSVVFGCGHCFHSTCVSADGPTSCPQCRTRALPMVSANQTTPSKSNIACDDNVRSRPDVEGHF